MRSINCLALFSVVTIITPQIGLAQEQDPANKILIEQARYWQAKNDYSRAATIWNKVLLSNVNQSEAIYGLAQNELKKNNMAGVNLTLARLKNADPNSRYIALLEQDIYLQSSGNAKILDNARLLGETDKFDESVVQYDILLKGKTPQGAIALEYYDRLGHTANGWKTAKVGLERLSKESPNNRLISLSLGNLLIRNESTRIEGAEQLSRLTSDPGIGGYASEGLHSALTWMGVPQPKAFPLFESYLKNHPDDANIRAQLNAGIKQQQRLAQESTSVLTPQDTRAASSFALAKKFLAAGDDVGARAALDKSLKLDPDNPWARLELARLYIKSGQTRSAEDLMYNMPYSSKKNQANIEFATAIFATETQEWVRAQNSIDKIPVSDRTSETKELQKTLLIRQKIDNAILLSKKGNAKEGLSALDQVGITSDSKPNMVALLANAYLELGEKKRAINLMQQSIAKSSPPSADSLMAYAALLMKANEDAEAASMLATLQRQKLSASEQAEFDNLLFSYSLRQANELRAGGRINAAEDRLSPLLVQRPNDPQVITALADVYQASGENKKALNLYQQLVLKNPNNIDIQLGAAKLGVQLGETDFVNARLEAALAISPNDPIVMSDVARIYRSEGKTQKAELLLKQALALMNTSDKVALNSNSTRQFNSREIPTLSQSTVPLPASSVLAQSLSNTLGSTAFYQTTPITQSQKLVMEDLNEIKQERSPEVLIGTQIRNRSGNSGTSKLTDVEMPIEIRLPAGDGKAIVQVTPISLNSGAVGSDNYSISTFGNAISGSSQPSQSAQGVGLSVGFKTNGIAADVGTTPVGFTYSNFTGGLKLDGSFDDNKSVSYLLNISSRPITDSLLSFAGTKDAATGNQWGGVMASGGRLGLTKDLGGVGFYGVAALHAVNGHNVASNSRTEFGGGMYFNVYKRPDSELITGLNVTNLGYKKNLSYFTYGQGGYFSPQQYNSITIPLTWAAQSNRLSYQVSAAVGYQQYTQDASNYFPNNGALQAASGNPIYTGQSSSGAAYRLSAGSEYQVAPKFFIGARGQTDNTATGTYRQWGAGLYARYSFESIVAPIAIPFTSFNSPYGL